MRYYYYASLAFLLLLRYQLKVANISLEKEKFYGIEYINQHLSCSIKGQLDANTMILKALYLNQNSINDGVMIFTTILLFINLILFSIISVDVFISIKQWLIGYLKK